MEIAGTDGTQYPPFLTKVTTQIDTYLSFKQISKHISIVSYDLSGYIWLQIHLGLRLIRPQDISTTNSVSSAKIAEAQIEYVGAGILDSATKPGWGSKIFRAISPF